MNPDTKQGTATAIVERVPVQSPDGARFELLLVAPATPPVGVLYWLAAMGVAARRYLPLAQALAERGIAVALHEWRGIGSSDQRASRRVDWGYRELLAADLPSGWAAMRHRWPDAPCCLGGHSLGGQLAALFAALAADVDPDGLVLVASGAPYWRRFRRGRWIRLAYVLAPWLATTVGYLPGRRIGFGGNEARGVIADWSRSGRNGRYAAAGVPDDLEDALSRLDLPTLGVLLADDWLAPAASLDWLIGKMPRGDHRRIVLTAAELGVAADHFAWMEAPATVAGRVQGWMAQVVHTAP